MSAEQDKLLQQAVKAHKAGDSQAAERLYRSILEIDSAHPDANHNLGVLIVHTQDAKHALPYLKTALEANPKQMQYWLSAIDALIRADQIEVARNLLQRGQEKGLKGEQADKLVARIESSQGSKTSADSLPSEKLEEILSLYKQGKFEEALFLATELDKISFDNPNVSNIYAVINSDLGNYEVAISAFKRAISFKPDFDQAYCNLGIAFHRQGKYQESITACNKALELRPNFSEAHNNLGRYEEADKSFSRALELDPNHMAAISGKARVLLRWANFKEELPMLERAEGKFRFDVDKEIGFRGGI